jgi:hypothetical protein
MVDVDIIPIAVDYIAIPSTVLGVLRQRRYTLRSDEIAWEVSGLLVGYLDYSCCAARVMAFPHSQSLGSQYKVASRTASVTMICAQ